jgi:eukaryotic-like serine/threonine-protein kinase
MLERRLAEVCAGEGTLQLGPYRILGELGRGGMGIVYEGVHVETGESVAIKRAIEAHAQERAALRREIESMRRIRHPGIVHVIDEGATEGWRWVAMPRLRGQTLRQRFAALWSRPSLPSVAMTETDPIGDQLVDAPEVRVPVQESRSSRPLAPLLTLMGRLCAPLAFLHGEGLVHRDLKPENIFIQDDGRPVLLDLGIAAHFAGSGGREELGVDDALGTPQYVAPEQIRGELVDARADLYALGCILYECVTGRPPFSGTTRAVLHQHENEPPISPSLLVPGISQALDRLILRLLEKRPRDRIGYATDVAAALAMAGATWEPDEGPAPRTYLYRSEILGRGDAVEALKRSVERRRGGLSLVSGESGIGKTRVVKEVAQAATQRGVTVIAGTCVAPGAGEAGATTAVAGPLAPLRPLLVAAMDLAQSSRRVADLLTGADGQVLAADLPREQNQPPAPPAFPPDVARERVIQSLRRLFSTLDELTPTLLLIDDLQWADDLTLSFLHAIADGGEADSRALVVATYRSEEARPEIASLESKPGVTSIPLARLPGRIVAGMVEGMLGGNPPPRAAIDALTRHSNGNPFFVAAYLRAALDERILRRNEQGAFFLSAHGAVDALSALSLPSTLAELLARRLDRLSADERALVEWAAILGQELDEDLLLAGPLDDGFAIIRALDELRARQILEETLGSDLRFVHDKIREIAYARISDVARISLHLRAGEVLEERRADTASAARIAHHFSRAGLHERAGRYFILAAEHARDVYANDTAIRFFRAAIEALSYAGASPAELDRLDEGLGDLLALTGRQEEARGAFEAALARTPGASGIVRARLLRKVGKTWEMHHQHDDALALYARAEAALGTSRAPEAETEDDAAWWHEWLQIQHDRISVHYWLADVERLSALVDAIRPVVESRGTTLERARYLHALTQRNLQVERFAASSETVRYAHACKNAFLAASASPDDYWGLVGRASLAIVLVLHGDLRAAEGPMAEALYAAQRTGDLEAQVRCLTYLTVIHRRLHRRGPAEALAKKARSLAREREMLEYVGAAIANLAWVALVIGDIDEALGAAEEALSCWEAQPRHVFPFHWLARLPLLAARVQRAQIDEAIEEARALLHPRQQRLPLRLTTALGAAVDAATTGDDKRVRKTLGVAIRAAHHAGYL